MENEPVENNLDGKNGDKHDTKVDQRSDEDEECFQLFDKKGADSIPSSLVIDILRSLGLNPLERHVNKILQQESLVNKEIGFEVFFSIFHHFVTTFHTELKESDVFEALNTLADRRGFIEKHSVVTLLSTLGEPMDDDQVEGMLEKYVNDIDGTVDIVPWVQKMLGQEDED